LPDGALHLLPSGPAADTPRVGRFVAVVICAALVAPAAADSAAPVPPLLRRASQLSGLKVRRPVRVVVESGTRFEADVTRALDRDYPRTVQRLDDSLYMGLGLLPAQRSIRSALISSAVLSRAYYDARPRVLRERRRPAPTRSAIVHEFVRALVDQNFGLRRVTGLRGRDRDAALAANAVVDGTAALASGLRASAPHGSPLARFLAVEQSAGLDFGRQLVAQLRYLGGKTAVASALRTFPRTTEAVLHLDKFLQREPALPISLAPTIRDVRLSESETFGELDVLALLRAFDLADADTVADGWGGGRLALYATAGGQQSVALVLRWDTSDDAAQWRAAAPLFVAAAFPDAQGRLCPAVDQCWLVGDRELAAASNGDVTVLASGAEGELVAAALTS